MQEISNVDYYTVKPLLKGAHIHPEIVSIIEGNNPGWIYVDELTAPKSALVWNKGMQGFYLIGDHINQAFIHSLDRYVTSHIVPSMKEHGLEYFEVSGEHEEWDLELMFPSRKLYPFEQMVFKLLNEPAESLKKEISTINLKTLNWEGLDLLYSGTNIIHDNIDLFWSSKADFADKGFGYAAVKGSEIIGVCYSSFVTDDTHAIGIETLSKYQNRGVGAHLAALVTTDILANGFTPYWDCSTDNEASKRLALRLGFELVHQYKCCAFAI